jgi:two-component system phosphate regulon sensor histidine kinase PhoR
MADGAATNLLIAGLAAVALIATAAALLLWRRLREATSLPDVQEAAPGGGEDSNLLAAFADPLLVVRDRRVLIANQAARDLLGAHIEGGDVRLAIRHPAAAEHLARDEDGGEPVSIELVGLGELGRPWELLIAPLPGGSQLVRLIDQSQIRAAEQMRVDFVANASHELRTPLATLIGFIETLQDEAAVDPATRQRFVGIMAGEALRMRDLLDDLMSLSRIEADRFAAPRDTVDLRPLIEEVRDALKPFAEGRAIRVERGSGEALVAGDRGQLAQMLNNLVVNSLKYGRAGSQVRIRLKDAGPDLISVSVIDHGDGINADHIPRLTERFYRVDPGRSRQVGGTGLGLAIVKHIVLRHRGRLDIKSTPGVGTTVEVTLPRAAQA